jgi:hypothetical protein
MGPAQVRWELRPTQVKPGQTSKWTYLSLFP